VFVTCASGNRAHGDDPAVTVFENVVFQDEFEQPDNSLPDAGRWVIGRPEDPGGWWVQGRTFFPNPAQHPTAPFPHVAGGALVIEHHQYNPYHLGTPKTTFLGGEIHTVMEFDPSGCYRFEARVRWPQCPRGLVSSFFTYGYDAEHADSDEIDFEFLSNEVFEAPQHRVLTNPWNNSEQEAVAVPIAEIDLAQWQTFRIYWYPDSRVEWVWIDPRGAERLLRSDTDATHLPDEPMSLYFNFWAPTSGWPEAYDAGLQPDQQDSAVKYEYWIDRAEVRVGEEARTWYRDADNDGFGNPNIGTQAVQQRAGYVSNDDDCDDDCVTCYPGATEVCDGEDNDCDGQTDEGGVCDDNQSGQDQLPGGLCSVVATILLAVPCVGLARGRHSRRR